MDIYSAIVLLTILSMVALLFMVYVSDIVRPRVKTSFYLSCIILSVAAFTEWVGVKLDGSSASLIPLHNLVKCIELSIAPYLTIVWASVLSGARRLKMAWVLMTLNSIAEIASMFNGMIFYVDAANYYHHGPLYPIYIIAYLIAVAILIEEVFHFSRIYQGRNVRVLVVMFSLCLIGLFIQMFNSNTRVDWIFGAVTSLLLYNYVVDLTLKIDSLTNLLNRLCFEKKCKDINYNTGIFFFDVDDFKMVNDTYGHAKGDEVLQKVSAAILKIYGPYGLCYRIGGDEFCVILKKRVVHTPVDFADKIECPYDEEIKDVSDPSTVMRRLNYEFANYLDAERQKDPVLPDVSFGYAIYDGSKPIADVVHNADSYMYKKKLRKIHRKGRQ